jgi:hypothetical protein
MKKLIYFLFTVLLLSCSPKIMDIPIRKYIGTCQECLYIWSGSNVPYRPVVTLVYTDSLCIQVLGRIEIPTGTPCYIRYKKEKDVPKCKGILEFDNKIYRIYN